MPLKATHSCHRVIALLSMAASLLAGACTFQSPPDVTREQATVDYDVLLSLPQEPVSFTDAVLPVLERRCVVCHGCYDAPCQLKLSSREGVARGANPLKVYDGSRISAVEPTRLFIDAHSAAEWREKGFHPVVSDVPGSAEDNLHNSVLYQLLRLKQLNPQPRVGMLPESFTLELDREQECPNREQLDDYARRNPLWGMPYAMPNLNNAEYRTLVQWLAQGAPEPPESTPSAAAARQIETWEAFLNRTSPKQQLVSRYLYEHLFIAHIHFDGTPDREFFRLVRSTTPPGQPVDEIATVRPYDDPGSGPHYYRLSKYPASIVAKDHVVYELSDARLQRYRELFLQPDYTVAELPSYDIELSSNPFRVFAPIPVQSRYRFLLDDARFFIEGFIKGPVCRGQVALNVIEDQFWVMFFDPDIDIIANRPEFLDSMSEYFEMPVVEGDNTLGLLRVWNKYWDLQTRYMNAKQAWFEHIDTVNVDAAMNYIWDGEGNNPNAALTVFRHFDSASVSFGLLGDYPETAWVIDYPMLERIHYLLVAGFNVFGNVGHQLNTRLYMDFLRMEGEDHFLAFLPASHRRTIRDNWYAGIRSAREEHLKGPVDWLDVESVTGYRTGDPQRELYRHIEQRLSAIARQGENLDRCESQQCRDPGAGAAEQKVDRAMQRIATMGGEHLVVFPDVAFVRVGLGQGEDALAYTLIHNKAYKDVTSMLADVQYRDRSDKQNDTLTVVNWLEGSYPNFFFDVDIERIDDFTSRYIAIRNREDYEKFVALYGVRRTNTDFWELADWFHDQSARERPVLSGLFDLNRYRNR
jgi:hypothetical protein